MDFLEFPKIARLNRECVITEKIDGTNAQVFIRELPDNEEMPTDTPIVAVVGNLLLYAGSRTRWITPQSDNYGFAAWVKERAEDLAQLGPGQHFGEWWGAGIQRRYGLGATNERRFSLFNVGRWYDVHGTNPITETTKPAPASCHVVPILTRGVFSSRSVEDAIERLRTQGSIAAPGFMSPEGVVIYHEAARTLYKVTCEKDEEWKGKSAQVAVAS